MNRLITLKNGTKLNAKLTKIPLTSKNCEDEFIGTGNLSDGTEVKIYKDCFNWIFRY